MSRRKSTRHFSATAVGKWRLLLRSSQLSTPAKCVGYTLTTYVNGDMLAWPGRHTLAADTSLSVRSVDRALAALEDAGFLDVYPPKKPVRQTRNGEAKLVEQRRGGRVSGGKGYSNEYTLVIPTERRATDVPPISNRATQAQRRATHSPKKGDTAAPELEREPEEELELVDHRLREDQKTGFERCSVGDCVDFRVAGSRFCEEHGKEADRMLRVLPNRVVDEEAAA